MQPAEVRGRVVEEGCAAIVVDADQAGLVGIKCDLRGQGLGLDGEDEGGFEVEGVNLCVGGVEVCRVCGESIELQDYSVIWGMKKEMEG